MKSVFFACQGNLLIFEFLNSLREKNEMKKILQAAPPKPAEKN